ncbi:MAG: TIGR01459 family HAD-type hydrolase, partial [Hyphomicrobium sp.]
MSHRSPPPILSRAGELLARYNVLFCDVWGVLHDGHRAFEDACDALLRFRREGGTVILVSNAPVPGERVAAMLDARGVP